MEKIAHRRRAFVYKGRKVYEWDQTLEEVNLYTPAPPGITAREIVCKIQSTWFTLGAASAQHPFIDEALFSRANVSESFWTLEDGTIHVMVTKAKPGEIWLAFLKNHAPATEGEAQVLEQAIRKELMLERFQSENPGFDFSGASFNGAVPDPTTFLNPHMQGDNFSRALAEVDGLYKSGRLGAQERATARIGELIAAYSEEPHALGQLFARLGNTFQKHEENYMRWCVVCVLERVGRYLPRAAGWDGFVQSLQMLTASNDNVAHALALRAFVPIAGLLGGDLTVHHSVIRGLESESPAVLGAALMAADAIAACSVKFAAAIFPHVAQVATAPRAPCAADMRLSLRVRAVRILRHMHGTAELTRRAHLFCGELLRGAGRGEDALVEEVLRTMTALAAQSLVDVDAHVTTLQRLVTKPELGSNSSDNSVVRTALECMGILARVSSRAPFSGSLLLATAGNSALPDETRAAALTVAKILARRPLLHNLLPEAGTLGPSEQVCAALAPALAGPSTDVAAAAYALAGTLARHPDASDVERAAYAALVLNALRSELAGSPRWELLLASVDAIGCLQAHCAASSGEASVATSVAAALCAACSSGESSAPLIAKFVLGVSRVAPSLLGPPFAASIAPTLTSGRTDVLADLGAAALRIQDGLSYAEKVAQALLAVGDNWGCFKVARTAACVGAHAFAASLWAALHELKSVASRSVHLWLAVLHHVSVAESALARPDARRAVFHMKAAITLLKTSSSAQKTFAFQLAFLQARAQYVEGAGAAVQLLKLSGPAVPMPGDGNSGGSGNYCCCRAGIDSSVTALHTAISGFTGLRCITTGHLHLSWHGKAVLLRCRRLCYRLLCVLDSLTQPPPGKQGHLFTREMAVSLSNDDGSNNEDNWRRFAGGESVPASTFLFPLEYPFDFFRYL